MKQEQINRINELARKAKSPEGLTPVEVEERAALRQAYVDSVLGNLRSQLDHTVIQNPDGSRRPLKKRGDAK